MKVTYCGEDNYDVLFENDEFSEVSALFERGMLWSHQNDEPTTYHHLKDFVEKFKSLFND